MAVFAMERCPACDASPCVCDFSPEELADASRALSPEDLAEVARIRVGRCNVCRGTLWVCEDHPAEPWPHQDCEGAGSRCICNPEGAVDWREIWAEVPPEGAPH